MDIGRKKNDFDITLEEFNKILLNNLQSVLSEVMNTHTRIVVALPNKDVIILDEHCDLFVSLGWVHYISIFYGERSRDGNFISEIEYFNPDKKELAFEALQQRVTSAQPFRAQSKNSISLDELAELQKENYEKDIFL